MVFAYIAEIAKYSSQKSWRAEDQVSYPSKWHHLHTLTNWSKSVSVLITMLSRATAIHRYEQYTSNLVK